MAYAGIRHIGAQSFLLDDGSEIYVTNKFLILSGPREWLAPVGLSALSRALRDAEGDDADRLYISSDSPDRFDSKYPGHILDVSLEVSPEPKRLAVVIAVECEVDDEGSARDDFTDLLAPLVARHNGSRFHVRQDEEFDETCHLTFDIPTRGKTVNDALAIGEEVQALLQAAEGGKLTLASAADLVRAGHVAALLGQREGPWFDGKAAPYVLSDDAKKWELVKDVASFANTLTGGLIVIGAKTRRDSNGDVVCAVTDFDLSLVNTARYRALIMARVHPRIEGLEIRTVPTSGNRGIAYIYLPPQRGEVQPFVVKGVVVDGEFRDAHVSIPTRDGEDTRYADMTEVHSLLQAGRAALRQ